MKALKSGNAQTTLSRRQQEQQAKIKKVAIAVLIAVLIFLALLMLESNLIQDEIYTYVVTANSDISSGTVITEANLETLFSATAISSRSSDEYNKITMQQDIPHFNSAGEAMDQIKKYLTSSTYTANNLAKMQYINPEKDLTTYSQYIESSTTTSYYANSLSNPGTYHTVKVVDPVDIAFNGGDVVKSSAGGIREGDIAEIGYTINNPLGETEYVNGWSKDYNEAVLITHDYNDEFQRKEGYYTVYKFGVVTIPAGNITDQSGNVTQTVKDVNLQRGTIYVSDAETTGAVLKVVANSKDMDAARQPVVRGYETYFDNMQEGQYILVKDSNGDQVWEPYNPNVDYQSIQVTPEEFDVNSHFMDMSAVHFSAVMTGPGSTIGDNVEDSETVVPTIYKIIISKSDIEHFQRYISKGSLIITKIMNAETDPHLVQPDYSDVDTTVISKYVDIKEFKIIRGDKELEQLSTENAGETVEAPTEDMVAPVGETPVDETPVDEAPVDDTVTIDNVTE